MDSWMNDERRDITRKYVHDMINSFVDDPKGTNYHNEYNPPYMMINSPDLQHLLVKSCNDDKYIVKWGEVGRQRGRLRFPETLLNSVLSMRISMISKVIV